MYLRNKTGKRPRVEGVYGYGRRIQGFHPNTTSFLRDTMSFDALGNKAEMTTLGFLSDRLLLQGTTNGGDGIYIKPDAAEALTVPGQFVVPTLCEKDWHMKEVRPGSNDPGRMYRMGFYYDGYGTINAPCVKFRRTHVANAIWRVSGSLDGDLGFVSVKQFNRPDFLYNIVQHMPYVDEKTDSNFHDLEHTKEQHNNLVDWGTGMTPYDNAHTAQGAGIEDVLNPFDPPKWWRPYYEYYYCSSVKVVCRYTIRSGGSLPMWQDKESSAHHIRLPAHDAGGGNVYAATQVGYTDSFPRWPNFVHLPMESDNTLRLAWTPFAAGIWRSSEDFNDGELNTGYDEELEEDTSSNLHQAERYTRYFRSADGWVYERRDIEDRCLSSNWTPFPVDHASLFGPSAQYEEGFHDKLKIVRSMFHRDIPEKLYKNGYTGVITFDVVPHKFLNICDDEGEQPDYRSLAIRTDSDLYMSEYMFQHSHNALRNMQIGLASDFLVAPVTGRLNRGAQRVRNHAAANNWRIGLHMCAGTLTRMIGNQWIQVELDYTFKRKIHLWTDRVPVEEYLPAEIDTDPVTGWIHADYNPLPTDQWQPIFPTEQ